MPEKVKEIPKKPNLLVIWGDDIGISHLNCYTLGLICFKTPNIDRLAKEGRIFTGSYGKSRRCSRCTWCAGRRAVDSRSYSRHTDDGARERHH